MSTNVTSHLSARGASVLTVACLLFLASCGRDTVAPAAPESSVSALGGGLAASNDKNDKNDGKKNDDKKGDDKKGDDKKGDDKKNDDKHGKNEDSEPGLVMATAPGGAAAGVAFTVQPVIELRNHGGNLVMANKSVTVSIVGSPVAPGGTRSVALVRGVARFTDLSIATAGTYTLLFTSDEYRPVRATITVAPRTVDLTVAVTGANGTVTSDAGGIDCPGTCTGTYDANAIVTLTAHTTPSLSTLQAWGGACSGNAVTCAVTLDVAKTVTATFVTVVTGPPQLTISFSGSGGGTITTDRDINPQDDVGDTMCTSPGSCTSTEASNDLIPLYAVPDANSTFVGWSGGCLEIDGTTCYVLMDSSKSVNAIFAANPQLASSNTINRTGFALRSRTVRVAGLQ